VSWLFLLNPYLTDAEVAALTQKKFQQQRQMAAQIQAGYNSILAIEGLSTEAKLKAAADYLSSVLPLMF
jgi:hypothetical protein